MSLIADLQLRLDQAIAAGVTPGAVLVVTTSDATLASIVAGQTTYGGAAVTVDTRYDAASLTKVAVTLPSILRLIDRGEIGLDDPVGRFYSAAGWFRRPSLADVTIRSLLAHASGLAAWRPLYAEAADRSRALAFLLNEPVAEASTATYSDLGFMLLGAIVERVASERLDLFAAREVFAPLGMATARFGPNVPPPVAPTEDCGWRNRLLVGEVHDENAWVWGGVAGHAGLFVTADDLVAYARAWLRYDPHLGSRSLLGDAVAEQAVGPEGERRGLGWQLAWPGGLGAAEGPATSFGHTGFTGTSIWFEPDLDRATVLLTNRVYPTRGTTAGIMALRRDVHARVRRDGLGQA